MSKPRWLAATSLFLALTAGGPGFAQTADCDDVLVNAASLAQDKRVELAAAQLITAENFRRLRRAVPEFQISERKLGEFENFDQVAKWRLSRSNRVFLSTG
jgi:hypothetical protein